MTRIQVFQKESSEKKSTEPTKLSAENGLMLLNHYRSALMGFAALWIYVFHEWKVIFDGHYKLLWVENLIKMLGYCGVDIFLFLSGIGLTYSIGKSKNIFTFYGKRIKRIILPFIAVALLNYRFDGWSSEQFWQNILCISFYRISIYEFLWFVPAILTLYLFFPLYYHLFIRSSGKIRFTLCAIIIWMMCSVFATDSMRTDLYLLTNRIPIFIIGILAGWLVQNTHPVFDRLTWKLMALMSLLGVYLCYRCIYKGLYILVPESDCCLPTMLIAASLPFLLARLLFALNEKRYFRWLGKGLTGILSFFGMFTLEFYCIQEWLAVKILSVLPAQYSNLTVNIILFSAVTAAALAMHFVFKYFWILVEGAAQKIHAACIAKRGGAA